MNLTRRNLLKFLGGSAAGLLMTPVPWKLLDDTSIWTQNWPWIPTPRNGKVDFKYNTCTLCPLGCGVRARCVNDLPVSLWGVPDYPLGRSQLCPLGLTGHHLAYHPLRLSHPLACTRDADNVYLTSTSLDEIVARVTGIISEINSGNSSGSVAVLDHRPGRMISRLYRRFLSGITSGVYIATPDNVTLNTIQSLLERPVSSLAYDLEYAGLLLNFGAPLKGERQSQFAGHANGRVATEVIQVGTRPGIQANELLPAKPGTEAILAMGLAHIIVRERLFDRQAIRRAIDFGSYSKLVKEFTPELVGRLTGVPEQQLTGTAVKLSGGKPAILSAEPDPAGGPFGPAAQSAIAGLNFLLGTLGRRGGIVAKPPIPLPDEFTGKGQPTSGMVDIPDHSIRLLILDAAEPACAFPWQAIERKLIPDESVVVALSTSLADNARYADYVISVPAYLETTEDMMASEMSRRTSFALSTPLYQPGSDLTEPIDFLRSLAAGAGMSFSQESEDGILPFLRRQVETIYVSGRGSVFCPETGDSISLQDITGAGELWQHLASGGCWLDEAPRTQSLPRFYLGGKPGTKTLVDLLPERESLSIDTDGNYPLHLQPFGMPGATGNQQVSPLLSKLFQESELHPGLNRAFINPATAREHGLSDGREALVVTRLGSRAISVRFDRAVAPGMVFVAVAPDPDGYRVPGNSGHSVSENILAICDIQQDLTWKTTPANVRKV